MKDQDADEAVEKTGKIRKEVTVKEEEMERLKEKYAELRERKQGLLHQVQRSSLYQEFMQRVVTLTKVLQYLLYG